MRTNLATLGENPLETKMVMVAASRGVWVGLLCATRRWPYASYLHEHPLPEFASAVMRERQPTRRGPAELQDERPLSKAHHRAKQAMGR